MVWEEKDFDAYLKKLNDDRRLRMRMFDGIGCAIVLLIGLFLPFIPIIAALCRKIFEH